MNLSLRPFTKRDIPVLKSWFHSESEVLLWAGASLEYPIRSSVLRAFIKAHRGPSPRHEIWAVSSEKVEALGHLQIWYSLRLRQAILGRVAIAPAYRGQGLARPLIKLAVDKAFSRTEINRIELRVYEHNTAAITAYKQVGFIHEGTLRKSTPIGKSFWSTSVMSILRDEYPVIDKRTEGE
ncbi:MAG: GNAT family N-acetyltransferase [Henriciella sp.]|nr:GNAT family N-acetyltransferase [Henriciella sp.]